LFIQEKKMDAKSIRELSHLVLSPDDKVALMEAKIARVEAQVTALEELARAQDSARGSKYPPR
jgi:hypothetical protein